MGSSGEQQRWAAAVKGGGGEEAARRGVRHAREWLRTEMTDTNDLALEIKVSIASRRDCGEECDAEGWCYWDAYIQQLQYAQQEKASGDDGQQKR